MDSIINKIRNDNNNNDDIVYREKRILYKKIMIVFNQTITSSDIISNYVIRSLNKIWIPSINNIVNRISNYKYKIIHSYKDLCLYLNSGFTILIYDKDLYIVLETRKDLSRGVSTPVTENTARGAMDAFNENIETNIGLIKRRIKSNRLWMIKYVIGEYTSTNIVLLYVDGITDKEIVKRIDMILKEVYVKGIITNGMIRNIIDGKRKRILPNIMSSEKPYTVVKYLLRGKIVILADNDPFALILPVSLNDYFLSSVDDFSKNINVTVTRIIRYLTFFITLLTPGVYIALTNFNQEIIPTALLISIASQRESVPFSTFVEEALMMLSFEILHESDLKMPSFASSAISIVGALILGEAAVSAGIVSPIMIIVVAITAISAFTFLEPEFINGLRIYRLLFMIGGALLGMYGIMLVFFYFLFSLANYELLEESFLYPFAPPNKRGFRDSVIKGE